jgi:8-oxo-dGTP pyrophosphatase MutT (NUDIX family)
MKKLFEMVRKFADAASQPREAVCMCAINGDKVLAVARRGTKNEWGLPGGKVDPGEDPVDALVREVLEETHISLDKSKLKPVFQRIDHPFLVTTYIYNGNIFDVPEQGDAGPTAWVSWDELLTGPFGEYNMHLKQTLGL